jgi:HK97 family phage prohead protease
VSKHKAAPLADFKAVNPTTGIFEAVASVFGNVDTVGDRVMPGAFKASLARWAMSGDPIPVLWSHRWDDPEAHIGIVLAAEERSEGLWIKAQLDVEKPFARQVYDLLKTRRVKEFGPDVLPLHRPRQGKRDRFPWHLTLPALKEAAADQRREPPGQLQ